MANLYRKPVIVVDPATGAKRKTKSKKWWGQFKDASGRLRRHPLAVDKLAAQAMLQERVRQVEREKAGLIEPGERERQRPVAEHLTEFRRGKEHRGISPKQVSEVLRLLERIARDCQWRTVRDIAAGRLLEFVGGLRIAQADKLGLSLQTCNHYLRAAKQFTRWLVRNGRAVADPLAHVTLFNTAVDRRHDRRALSHAEFERLDAAAQLGSNIEGMSGPDRAMLYVLAGWTGLRKGELGSLTRRSFQLDLAPAIVTVRAGYSKRRREDSQVLHPAVVARLRAWLATKCELAPEAVLFPLSGRVPGCPERKTNKMMERDLAAARAAWLKEAENETVRREREQSDFLCFRDHHGKFADFHALRHFFITNLERAGVSPKLAQTLARHSDIRLTLGIYTHVGLGDQTSAIAALPAPKSGDLPRAPLVTQ